MRADTVAEIWVDPSCPYTWLAARWLGEVARCRPVEIRWRLMSLAVLNEGRDDDPEGDPDGYLWVPVRICAAVLDRHGQDAFARYHRALWAAWGRGTHEWLVDPAEALGHAGLDRGLARFGDSSAYDEMIRSSHAEGVGLLGPGVGTPVIRARPADGVADPDGDGPTSCAFFGPVLSRVPLGERAGRLWDGVLLVAGTPAFHTLKGRAPQPPGPGPASS